MQYLIKFIYLVLHSNGLHVFVYVLLQSPYIMFIVTCCSKLPLKPFYLFLLRFASFMKIIYGNCWPKIKDTLYFALALQQTHIPNLLKDKCLFISEYIENISNYHIIDKWCKIHSFRSTRVKYETSIFKLQLKNKCTGQIIW